MENKITLTQGEIHVLDSALQFKTLKPFSVLTIKKEDFAGVNVSEEKIVPRSDWNYAFRFGALGLVLMIICFAIGYNINHGRGGLSTAFIYLGVAVAQLISFGALIILLSFWDAFFGTKLNRTMLAKLFGKNVMMVTIASNVPDGNVSFELKNDVDKKKVNEILKLNEVLK